GIIYRRHFIGQALEQALILAGIRCRLARGQALSDDPVIARVLAALRGVLYPHAELLLEHLAALVLPETVLAAVLRQSGTQGLLDRLRAHASAPGVADADKCWRFLYQMENLKGLLRATSSVIELIDTVLAQGIGPGEGPLEVRRDRLLDPEELPEARALADRLCTASEAGGRIVLAAANGLEVPARLMLSRVLPNT